MNMDKLSRKNFIKNACLSTACICGFGEIAFAKNNNRELDSNPSIEEEKFQLIKSWISSLLNNLQSEFDNKDLRPIIKQSSIIHYSSLKMDEMLTDYVGDLEKFLGFLEQKWGWKINYNRESKIIIADENKDFCVCPILNDKQIGISAICYCSEGFAEKMFSKVVEKPVKATVISSIRKGDKSCKYEINFN
jgi:hypothetical protein